MQATTLVHIQYYYSQVIYGKHSTFHHFSYCARPRPSIFVSSHCCKTVIDGKRKQRTSTMLNTPHSSSTLCQKATTITTNYIQFSSFFMGFHMVPLLKRMVWLKFLYIQKTDELLLETVECSDWLKIYFYKKILYKRKSCKGFFVKINFQPMRAQNL